MTRFVCSVLFLAVVLAAVPLRAANKPDPATGPKNVRVWTNGDLEALHGLGLISIVGTAVEEGTASDTAAQPSPIIHDQQWYSEQSEQLRAELERRTPQLQHYLQDLEDARTLRAVAGGIDLSETDVAITPQAGIEILQRRVDALQEKLDALEDQARRDGIPPGVLRGE